MVRPNTFRPGDIICVQRTEAGPMQWFTVWHYGIYSGNSSVISLDGDQRTGSNFRIREVSLHSFANGAQRNGIPSTLTVYMSHNDNRRGNAVVKLARSRASQNHIPNSYNAYNENCKTWALAVFYRAEQHHVGHTGVGDAECCTVQ